MRFPERASIPLRSMGAERRRLARFAFDTRAAAIAYSWVLVLIPLLLLGASALGDLAGSAGVDERTVIIRRPIPQATAAQVETAPRSLVLKRAATIGLGILSLMGIASGALDVIPTSLTAIQGGKEMGGALAHLAATARGR